MLTARSDRLGLNFSRILPVILVAAGLVIAWGVGNPTINWQVRAVLLLGLLLATFFVLASEASLRLHLYATILTLAFGWRAEQIAGVNVDAQLLFAWSLFLHFVIYRIAHRGNRQPVRGQAAAILALVAIAVGVISALARNRLAVYAVNEMIIFSLCVPVIFGLHNLVTSKTEYRRIEMVLAVTILLMSIPGLLEYVQAYAAKDVSRVHVKWTSLGVGFIGAQFSWWGTGATISYALNPIVLLLLGPVLSRDTPIWQRWFCGVALFFGSAAIVASGQRGAWIGSAIGLLVFCFLARRFRLLVVIGLIVGWLSLSDRAAATLLALFDPSLETGYYDTSAIARYLRIQGALEQIRRAPWLGWGWGGSGWVHSDTLQLAANLGIPTTVGLFAVWLTPFVRLFKTNRDVQMFWTRVPSKDVRLAALLAAGVSVVIQLSSEALIVISALSLPIWIVIGLGWSWWEMTRSGPDNQTVASNR